MVALPGSFTVRSFWVDVRMHVMVRATGEPDWQNGRVPRRRLRGALAASRLQSRSESEAYLGKHFASTIIVASILCNVPCPTLADGGSTYDLVLAGKKCETGTNQTLSCEYTVGNGLKFTITGIGQPDTGITFMKSSFDEDFYASYGLLHGCVIVQRGTEGVKSEDALEAGSFADYAFVSPRNGKVYKSWNQCQAAW
jgi:hypothetical protein